MFDIANEDQVNNHTAVVLNEHKFLPKKACRFTPDVKNIVCVRAKARAQLRRRKFTPVLWELKFVT